MKEGSVVNWLDSAQIKILLVPIGEFPDRKYDDFLERVNGLRKIVLSELALPSQDSDGTRELLFSILIVFYKMSF